MSRLSDNPYPGIAMLNETPTLLPIALIGESILGQAAIKVDDFNAELAHLAEQMFSSMAAANGVGIAAPQVHSPLALFIMASRPNERYPDAPHMAPEVVTIQRHKTIEVRYQNLQGEWYQAELTGFIARIFQHEFDHLQGITLLERSRMPEQTQALQAQSTPKGEAR
jgi:peptide deformylase